MMLNGGELDGMRLLGRKTVELMTTNHLPGGQDIAAGPAGSFADIPYAGLGFGLGFSVVQSPARAHIPEPRCVFLGRCGASTVFWIDPAEQLSVIFMTQPCRVVVRAEA